MSRLIDKDELMKALNISYSCSNCEYEDGAFCRNSRDFVNACEIICNAPTVTQWIPTSVKLPEKDDLYRVTVHPDYVCDGDVQVDDFYWHDGKWMYLGIEEREFVFKDVHMPVIAWKPLEEPYKE